MVMQRVTLDEVKELAKSARGSVDKIYLHWTAGGYHQFFIDYHFCVDNDGAIISTTQNLTETKAHTWRRNSRAIGIAMCCCADARCWADGSVDFGEYPPTAEQIDGTAKLVAVLCEELGIEITADNVMTHCEAAELDYYGPSTTCERWDLWRLPRIPGDGEIVDGGDLIRGKAIYWHYHL